MTLKRLIIKDNDSQFRVKTRPLELLSDFEDVISANIGIYVNGILPSANGKSWVINPNFMYYGDDIKPYYKPVRHKTKNARPALFDDLPLNTPPIYDGDGKVQLGYALYSALMYVRNPLTSIWELSDKKYVIAVNDENFIARDPSMDLKNDRS